MINALSMISKICTATHAMQEEIATTLIDRSSHLSREAHTKALAKCKHSMDADVRGGQNRCRKVEDGKD